MRVLSKYIFCGIISAKPLRAHLEPFDSVISYVGGNPASVYSNLAKEEKNYTNGALGIRHEGWQRAKNLERAVGKGVKVKYLTTRHI